MDLKMPVMDGFDAVRIIKNELNLSVPIIALSVKSEEEIEKKCIKEGFNDYLFKPLDESFLFQKIIKFGI